MCQSEKVTPCALSKRMCEYVCVHVCACGQGKRVCVEIQPFAELHETPQKHVNTSTGV